MSTLPVDLDTRLLLVINSHHTPLLDAIMVRLSYPGALWTIPALFIAWRLWKGDKGERLVWMGLILLVGLSDHLCSHVLKPWFDRPRPYLSIPGLHLFHKGEWLITTLTYMMKHGKSLAMPSCHSMNMWAATAYLTAIFGTRALPMMLLALGVGYSRVYLGLHYPGDVAAGMVMGALLGVAAAAVAKKLYI